MRRFIAVLCIVAGVFVAWHFRWQPVPLRGNDGFQMYLLDRWTGTLYVVAQDKRFLVRDAQVKSQADRP